MSDLRALINVRIVEEVADDDHDAYDDGDYFWVYNNLNWRILFQFNTKCTYIQQNHLWHIKCDNDIERRWKRLVLLPISSL